MPDFGDLRSVLHEPATKESWGRFVTLIEQFSWEDLEGGGLLDYIDDRVRRWPERERLAPTRWIDALIQGHDAEPLRWASHVRLPITEQGRLGAMPDREELRWITRLSAWAWPTLGELHDLLSSRHLSGLRALDLSHTQLGDLFVNELIRAEHWMRLEELTLRDVRMELVGAHSMTREWPPRLHTLSLAANPIGAQGIRMLCDQDRWEGELSPESLTSLDLRATGLEDLTIEIMVEQRWPDKLKSLQLSDNPITRRGLELILGHEPWRQGLRRLSLDGIALGDEGAQLIAQTHWGSLEELTLWRCGVGLAGAKALSESPQLPEAIRAPWRELIAQEA